ncbi:MAG TPA: hypothetical protein VNL91_04400 [Thermoanaerobaculia bacterium]|nr:hypothetical protein [Thermoanaerobaculia bacterium]
MTHGTPSYDLDLVILTADEDQRQVCRSLLSHQTPSLGIRSVTHEILKHNRRDPGCLNEAEDILRSYHRRARHALVMFDHDGCGMEARPAAEVERIVFDRLYASGWEDRAAVIVIEPELEAWVWSDSPEVERVFEWQGDRKSMTAFLEANGILRNVRGKFVPPKKAVDLVLRETGLKRSSALFGELAERVSLQRCTDGSFRRLANLLLQWFPRSS